LFCFCCSCSHFWWEHSLGGMFFQAFFIQ
jgi:hypothetical protein